MGQPVGEPADPPPHHPERFIWPPRPVPQATPLPSDSTIDPRPAAAPSLPTAGDSPLDLRPPAGGLAGLWRHVESVWLGLTIPPLPVRAAAAGWSPDDAHGYCPRCGTTAGQFEAGDAGCRVCGTQRLPWERFLRLGAYEGLLRQMIVEVKFTRWRRLGHELGLLLGERIAQAAAAERIDLTRALLVPMPTSFRRRLGRGIDHALVVTRGASQASGVPVCRCLDRRHRPSQRSVAPSRRRSNAAGSFRLRPGSDLAGRTIIVIDDVRTTGATMSAACRAIRAATGRVGSESAPERLWAAVLGVTPEPGLAHRPKSPVPAPGEASGGVPSG